MAILLIFTIFIQFANPGTTDVSWLIVVDNKILGGAQLYDKLLEVNPPASALLYLLPTWLALKTSARAEHLVIAFMILEICLAFWLAGRMLGRNLPMTSPRATAIAATSAFALVAGHSFAQREHIAVIALLPMLALTICRLQGSAKVHLLEKMAVGVLAGIAISIKPQFALGIALPQLYAVWSQRSLRPMLGLENWMVAAVFGGYMVSAFTLFPQYWSGLFPILLETYRPSRLPIWELLFRVGPFLVFPSVYIATSGRSFLNDRNIVPLLAAIGFLIGYFEQGKGWSYHFYPYVALCLFVVMNAFLAQMSSLPLEEQQSLPWFNLRVITAITFLIATLAHFAPYSQVSASLESSIESRFLHPRVLAISGDLGVGFPLTRRVNGTWVGSVPSQWLTENSVHLLKMNPDYSEARRKRLEALIEQDRQWFLRDFVNGDPDVLLIDTRKVHADWQAWARADPAIDRQLGNYVLVDRNKDVALYVRRNR